MARVDGKFIKGTVGKVVYKEYRGEQVIQESPKYGPGSQTEGTKKAATVFGIASKLATSFRDRMASVITDHVDGPMVNRFNSEVMAVLNQTVNKETQTFQFKPASFNRLIGFEFNMNSPVRNMFFAQPQVTVSGNNLAVDFPEIKIPSELKFPKETKLCMLHVATGLFDLTYGHVKLNPIESIEIEYPYKPVLLAPRQVNFEIEPGCLCITIISFQFFRNTFAGKLFLNTKKFNPVAILHTFIADGAVDAERTKSWREIDFKTL